MNHAVDPRVVGNGTDLKWAFDKEDTNIVGYVIKESNGVTGSTIMDVDTQYYPVIKTKYANGGWVSHDISHTTSLATSKTDTQWRTTSFTYDQSGYGFLTSLTDPLNRVTSYGRTSLGNLSSKTNPDSSTGSWTRDSLDLVLTKTDELSHTTTYTRDTQHRVTRIDYPDSSYETFTYNAFGQVLSHRLQNGGTEYNTYDTVGRKLTHTDSLANVTSYTYNSNNLLETVTDPRGYTTTYSYTERGQIDSVTHPDSSLVIYTYDNAGDMLTRTNELGKTWTYTFDEFKRLTSVTDPLSRTTSYSYDLPGGVCGCTHPEANVTMLTLPSGKQTHYTYDTEWQLKTATVGYGTADVATTSYTYDKAGNITKITDPMGKAWNFIFNSRNWRTSEKNPLNQSTTYTYDAAGYRLIVKRPDNGLTTNVFDNMNRVVSTENPNTETTTYSYDDSGNVVSLTDAKNHTYSFEYDLLDRRTKLSYPDTSNEQWTYDDAADVSTPMITYQGRDGSTAGRIYDNRGRETSCNYSAANTPDVTKTYDAAGRLLTAASSVSGSTYTYDDANRLLSDTTLITALGGAKTVSYTYDADGNRASLTYPDSSVVDYAYTNRNQLAEITAGGPPPLATYTYDLNGNRIGKALENGTEVSYTYDNASRLTQVRNFIGGTTLAQFAYTLNSVGNRTEKAITGSVSNRTETYGYDAIDQVTSANYGTRSETFNYDAVGNRTSLVDSSSGSTSYTVNNLNQYIAVTGLSPIAHDARGNLTANGVWTYAYDSPNHLLSAIDGSTTALFAYDWQNHKVSRSMNGVASYYIYDGWNLIAEYDASGSLMVKYVHGAQTDEMLVKIDSSGPAYYHQDGLGSNIALTDNVGALLESYEYDVYGTPAIFDSLNTLIYVSNVNNRFLYTGCEWIREIGLYDLRYRVYSPELGRFLQSDPIRFLAGDVNLVRYASNDAVNMSDSLGLYGQSVPCPAEAYTDCDQICKSKGQIQDRSKTKCYDTTTPLECEAGLKTINWNCGCQDPCKGLRKQLDLHKKKLEQWKEDPYSMDNKGYLKNAEDRGDVGAWERLYNGRIRELESQVSNFQQQYSKCLEKYGY